MKKEYIIGCIIFLVIIIIYDYLYTNGIKDFEHTKYDKEYRLVVKNKQKQRPTILINNKYMIRNPKIKDKEEYFFHVLEIGDSIFIPQGIDSIYLYRSDNLIVKSHYYRSK